MDAKVPDLSLCRPAKRSRKIKHPYDFLPAEEMKRKYLVSGDGRCVGIDHLRGKFVGFLFAESYTKVVRFLPELREVCDDIRRTKGDVLELVYVAIPSMAEQCGLGRIDDLERGGLGGSDDLVLFQKLMPLAVPLDDLEWRQHLCNSYCSELGYRAIRLSLFDKEGHLLEGNALTHLLDLYGSAYYPFTDEREFQLMEEYEELLHSKTLQALLGTATRDFVISCHDGGHTKVPISQLEGKVIGVYLYNGERHGVREKLMDIYSKLICEGRNFEIVFVNLDYMGGYKEETSFYNNLRQMPWLALPFKDEKIRALQGTLTCVHADTLAIVGAHGGDDFVYLYGFQVIREYGIKAYPFTLDGAVKVEKRRLNQIKLLDAFKGMGVDFLVQKVGKDRRLVKRSLSTLRGKRVIFYMADWCYDKDPPHQGSRLVNLYKKDRSFQVVFVPLCSTKYQFVKLFDTMPKSWLAVPLEETFSYLRWKEVVLLGRDGLLIAFGGSRGKLVRIGWLESFGCDANHFPFISREHFVHTLKTFLPGEKGLNPSYGFGV